MLLLFSIVVADCLKKSCFFSVYHMCLSLIVVYRFLFCFEGRGVGSESEKEHFN